MKIFGTPLHSGTLDLFGFLVIGIFKPTWKISRVTAIVSSKTDFQTSFRGSIFELTIKCIHNVGGQSKLHWIFLNGCGWFGNRRLPFGFPPFVICKVNVCEFPKTHKFFVPVTSSEFPLRPLSSFLIN